MSATSGPRGVRPALAAGAAGLAALALAATAAGIVGARGVAAAAALYGAVAVAVLAFVGARHPHPRFGAANGITLARAALVAAVAGLVAEPQGLAQNASIVVALALAALALDGADGYAARRLGLESPFGARFDVEVDGLLLSLLALAALLLGKAGPWVLLIGGIYYVFLAAKAALPWLDGPLAPSFRRKAVCVVQGGALVAMLLPPVAPPLSGAIGAGALAALVVSFAIDVRALRRARGDGGEAPGARAGSR